GPARPASRHREIVDPARARALARALAQGGMGVSAEHESHLESCAAYALGSLDEADRVRFEEHLSAGCAECEAALADFAEASVLRAGRAPAVVPAPDLRARVMKAALAARPATVPQATGARRPAPAPRRRPALGTFGWTWRWAAAAAFLAVVAAVG